MNKYFPKSVVLVVFGAVFANMLLIGSASAERIYHRMRNSDIIKIPDAAPVANTEGFRQVTEDQLKEILAKTGEELPSKPKTPKLDKWHEIKTSRFVWLLAAPGPNNSDYQTEEKWLKSKKDQTIAPKK